MMDESTEDAAAEMCVAGEETRGAESNDNGALRSSGFVLVSDAGSEVSSLRHGGPPQAPSGPPPLATHAFSTIFPADHESSPSREHSTSPPANPYRGHLPHLQHGYSHSHEGGHGHSHESGHGHSHDTCSEPAPLPAAFFTPSAPAADAPLPNFSPPRPAPVANPPAGGVPFPQYQLPQFQRSPQPPTMERGPDADCHIGLSLDDAEAAPGPCGEQHGHSHDGGHGHSHDGGHGHSHDGGHGHSHDGGHGHSHSGGGGFLSAFFGSELVHKVVEKTKSGMESVITTLDPGMKEYIKEGGDVNLVIASFDELEATTVREAFYTVFGRATVRIVPPQISIDAKLFGAEAARNMCLQQMTAARSSGFVPPDAAFLSIASFLRENTPGRWFVTEYLLLQDPTSGTGVDGGAPLECDAYSIALSVPASIVEQARTGPQAFEQLMTQHHQQLLQQQQASIPNTDWRQARFGVSRRHLIGQAARLLARDYRESSRGRFEALSPVFHS